VKAFRFSSLTRDQWRLFGSLPLLFFCAQALHYWRINELGHMLWMCNIGNLVLAIGLFTEQRTLIRVAALWMIPGVLVWLIYVVFAWGVFFTSTLAHVGGLIVGMIALKHVGMDRGSWLYAMMWYFAVQLVSRVITPPAMNVNLAHNIDPGWQSTFASYWKFWIVLTIAVAGVLWLLSFLFRALWPSSEPHLHST
jgi:hypothetical protein